MAQALMDVCATILGNHDHGEGSLNDYSRIHS